MTLPAPKEEVQLSHGLGEERSMWADVGRRFLRHKLAMVGFVILAFLISMAVLGPYLAPHDPNRIILETIEPTPSAKHWLGLDQVGRDNFSRLLDAAKISLSVGIVAVSIYVTIGMVLGSVAGYFGGAVDVVIMRAADMVLSFPSLMLIMVIVSVVGPSIWNVMIVLGLLGWPSIARLVRGEFLSLRERDFVQAGKALGLRDARIIFRHILPNATGPVLVAATFGTAQAILTEAALSFLGMGVQPPQASWGNMLSDAQSLTILEEQPWLWVPPGLMIFLAVLAINFVGDGLRDALDPRLKQ